MLGANELSPRHVKNQIWRIFTQTHGLTLQAEATAYLFNEISKVSFDGGEEDLLRLLTSIATEYKHQPGILLAKCIENLW